MEKESSFAEDDKSTDCSEDIEAAEQCSEAPELCELEKCIKTPADELIKCVNSIGDYYGLLPENVDKFNKQFPILVGLHRQLLRLKRSLDELLINRDSELRKRTMQYIIQPFENVEEFIGLLFFSHMILRHRDIESNPELIDKVISGYNGYRRLAVDIKGIETSSLGDDTIRNVASETPESRTIDEKPHTTTQVKKMNKIFAPFSIFAKRCPQYGGFIKGQGFNSQEQLNPNQESPTLKNDQIGILSGEEQTLIKNRKDEEIKVSKDLVGDALKQKMTTDDQEAERNKTQEPKITKFASYSEISNANIGSVSKSVFIEAIKRELQKNREEREADMIELEKLGARGKDIDRDIEKAKREIETQAQKIREMLEKKEQLTMEYLKKVDVSVNKRDTLDSFHSNLKGFMKSQELKLDKFAMGNEGMETPSNIFNEEQEASIETEATEDDVTASKQAADDVNDLIRKLEKIETQEEETKDDVTASKQAADDVNDLIRILEKIGTQEEATEVDNLNNIQKAAYSPHKDTDGKNITREIDRSTVDIHTVCYPQSMIERKKEGMEDKKDSVTPDELVERTRINVIENIIKDAKSEEFQREVEAYLKFENDPLFDIPKILVAEINKERKLAKLFQHDNLKLDNETKSDSVEGFDLKRLREQVVLADKENITSQTEIPCNTELKADQMIHLKFPEW